MFIKHGDGKIISIIKSEEELEKVAEELKRKSAKQSTKENEDAKKLEK